VSRRYTDKTGQKQERAEWHQVVAGGKLAGLYYEYLREGRNARPVQVRRWEAKTMSMRTRLSQAVRARVGARAPALPFLVSALPTPVYVLARSSVHEMTGIGVGSPDGEP